MMIDLFDYFRRTASAPITRNGFSIDNIVYDGYSEVRDPEIGMSSSIETTQNGQSIQQPSTSKESEDKL